MSTSSSSSCSTFSQLEETMVSPHVILMTIELFDKCVDTVKSEYNRWLGQADEINLKCETRLFIKTCFTNLREIPIVLNPLFSGLSCDNFVDRMTRVIHCLSTLAPSYFESFIRYICLILNYNVSDYL